jgi:hypothetical protein
MDSTLTSVKKMLGITEEYDVFDKDLIMHINSVFMILSQLGVGPANGFSIIDKDDKWTDFIPEDNKNFESVKSYMFLKVRLIFDPPTGSVVKECMQQMINELEWRLNLAAEST